MSTFSGRISWQPRATLTGTPSTGTLVANVGQTEESEDIANGTGTDQCNELYSAERVLAAVTDDDLDLSGVLSNVLNESLILVKVRFIEIKNLTTDETVELEVGGAAANAWEAWCSAGSKVKVRGADGRLQLFAGAAGYAVTAGTADVLRIRNTHASLPATYRITIFGNK